MSKPSDKVFHLIVSAFALTLTAVSVVSVLYQHHPDEVKSWIKPLQQTPWLTRFGIANDVNITTPPTRPSTGSNSPPSEPAVAKAGFTAGDNASLIHFTGYGNDVTPTQLQQATDLLSKYDMANVIAKSLRMNLSKSVHIYVAQNAADYKNVLSWLGVSVSEAQQFSQDTGGFTLGNSIVIPLYQNKTSSDLANTLAHELTHAFLNANVGDALPSWANEGTAVTMGMEFQQLASDNPTTYEGYARQMAEGVLDATQDGKLIPLTADESKVLTGDSNYDLELQDWLAVRYLVNKYGFNGLSTYLHKVADSGTDAVAFNQTFGMTSDVFNRQFTSFLQQSLNTVDGGVAVDMQVPSSYKGYVRILQHSSQTWVGFRAGAGDVDFSLSPSGTLTGQGPVRTVKDSSPADESTTYIDLDPDNDVTYQGQAVDNCGFAVDYHYGMYAFVNAWVTFKSGKSVYLQDPSLFGVTLRNIQEVSGKNALVSLLTTPKP